MANLYIESLYSLAGCENIRTKQSWESERWERPFMFNKKKGHLEISKSSKCPLHLYCFLSVFIIFPHHQLLRVFSFHHIRLQSMEALLWDEILSYLNGVTNVSFPSGRTQNLIFHLICAIIGIVRNHQHIHSTF